MSYFFRNRWARIYLAFVISFTSLACKAQNHYYLLAGTYTSNTPSKGIYVLRLDTDSGTLQQVNLASAVQDPSYLAVSADQHFVYAVNELSNGQGSGGSVSAFAFDNTTGTLRFLNKVPSGGDHPCYIDLHPSGKWAAIANYTSGSLSIVPIHSDGTLGAPVTRVQHEGSGPNADRQEKAHVHSTVFSPDGRYLYVADLGTDKEYIYRFNEKNGHLEKPGFPGEVPVDPGAGPRHFIIHPSGKFAYLVEEMGGAVCAFTIENGALHQFQRMSALPTDFEGQNTSADIHCSADGLFLYVSNRGESNSIAAFSIQPQTGRLAAADYQSTLGQVPRNFTIHPDGRFLLVANQKTNNIVVFDRNPATGQLTDLGHSFSLPAPVCLKWIEAK